MDLNKINFTDAESSQISALGHDAENNLLYVKFKNQKVAEYTAVDAALYNRLLTAESVGKFFNANIKADTTAHPFRYVN